MKKTSLLLAISALLYGTSGTFALADEINIYPGMPEADIIALLEQMDEVPPPDQLEEVAAENEGLDVAVPTGVNTGLQPFPNLPPNVSVLNDTPVHKNRVCKFTVDGAFMANFPVTVDGVPATWVAINTTTGEARSVAVGIGWILVQSDDTWGDKWNRKWKLYTNVPITTILLEPWRRSNGDGMITAFDLGGSKGDVPQDEHTKGSARGWAITSPSSVGFQAVYSTPVITPQEVGAAHIPGDQSAVPPGGVPTHDLYGTLEITFDSPVKGNSLTIPAFVFRADTDCLPVVGASVSSNLLTLFGEGLVYVKETNSRGGYSLMPTPFEVAKDGVNTFDVGGLISNLQANHCYSLVNEGSLDTNIALEVNGKDMPGDMFCK